ncbi:MAG: dolichol kinase [Leptospiraceae bacterium]|nr:dolichol kinase [Leptospiraceae bacterium]
MDGFNFARKLFHWIGFFVPAILFFDVFKGVGDFLHPSRLFLLVILLFILISMSLIEYFRLHHTGFNEFYLKLFGALMKEAEKNRMNGVIPYMLSNSIIVAFFPAQIIFLAMAYLLVGDPFAAYFGAKYGKYRFYNGKSLVGVVAFIIASSIAGVLLMYIFYATYGDSPFALFRSNELNKIGILLVIVGAVSAALAEFFSGHALGGLLEDNLLIPVVSAIVLAFLSYLNLEFGSSEIIFPIQEIFAKR